MQTQLRLTPADHGNPLTVEDLSRADAEEGYHYEVIHGRLHVSPPAGLEHEELRDRLLGLLQEYARRRPDVIRRVRSPARVFLPGSFEGVTAPEPDVACYREFPSKAAHGERRWQPGAGRGMTLRLPFGCFLTQWRAFS